MSSRVIPFRASFTGNQEIPTSVTALSLTNDVPFNCESQEQENANDRLLKAVEEAFSPLLRAMKSFGIYYGDTTFKHFKDTSCSYRKRNVLPSIYCCVLASGFWLNFILASTAMIFDNDVYLVLMMSFWCLFMALNATISLVVLPITGAKKSRLEKYLRTLLAAVKTINLEKVKKNSRTALAVFCLLFMFAAAGILAGSLLLNFNIGTFQPWHRWFGFRIFAPTFLVIGVGSWLLPIIFFCITSLMLETLFDDLHRRMSPAYSTPSMDLKNFKVEYHKLCEVVELADKVLAPLLLVFVSVYIPLLCFSFYNVARPRDEDSQLFFLFNLLWFLFAAAILAVILVFGSKVGEKIYSFQKVLQVFPVSTADESKLLMFMMDIQGDPKGLSIGGLVVINTSMSLTVVGIIVSYFAVMLSLPG